MQLGLPEVCWAALKDGQVPIFWPLNRRQFLYLLIIPSNRYCHILCWSLFHTFVFFMFFPFCRFPEFLVSWCSSRSRCPSISESASVLLLRRRMPSADVVSGIFWMNWREPRIIYCFERKSFFASFVSFPRSKLQNKEVAGPQTSNSGYKREDASTGSRGDVFVVRKSKPVENLWKKWVILNALQFRYTFYRPLSRLTV